MIWNLLLLQDDQGHDSHCIQQGQRKIEFELIQVDQTKVLNSNDQQ